MSAESGRGSELIFDCKSFLSESTSEKPHNHTQKYTCREREEKEMSIGCAYDTKKRIGVVPFRDSFFYEWNEMFFHQYIERGTEVTFPMRKSSKNTKCDALNNALIKCVINPVRLPLPFLSVLSHPQVLCSNLNSPMFLLVLFPPNDLQSRPCDFSGVFSLPSRYLFFHICLEILGNESPSE